MFENSYFKTFIWMFYKTGIPRIAKLLSLLAADG